MTPMRPITLFEVDTVDVEEETVNGSTSIRGSNEKRIRCEWNGLDNSNSRNRYNNVEPKINKMPERNSDGIATVTHACLNRNEETSESNSNKKINIVLSQQQRQRQQNHQHQYRQRKTVVYNRDPHFHKHVVELVKIYASMAQDDGVDKNDENNRLLQQHSIGANTIAVDRQIQTRSNCGPLTTTKTTAITTTTTTTNTTTVTATATATKTKTTKIVVALNNSCNKFNNNKEPEPLIAATTAPSVLVRNKIASTSVNSHSGCCGGGAVLHDEVDSATAVVTNVQLFNETAPNSCSGHTISSKATESAMSSKYYAVDAAKSGDISSDSASNNNKNKDYLNIQCERCRSNCSPMSDEGCSTNVSPYSSSSEDDILGDGDTRHKEKITQHRDNDRDLEQDHHFQPKEKVARSSSSDSALGLEEDIRQLEKAMAHSGRRNTLTVCDIPLRPALLPLASPRSLPESPAALTPSDSNPSVVPSKIILEAHIVEIPANCCNTFSGSGNSTHAMVTSPTDDHPRSSDNDDINENPSDLRRVSSHSDIDHRVRYVRTPSVVVSDYSDDVYGGITLEDLEFLRRQRLRRTSLQDIDQYHSDVSAASSCSNLDFVGSTISGLDTIDDLMINMPTEYGSGLQTPERKISDCSTCSTVSGADDEETLSDKLTRALEKEKKKPSGWRKLRNIVQWTPFFQTYKKQRYPWVQLAGHQGNFKAGPDPGTVLKKLCPKEEKCFTVLMKDVLRPYVPEYKGQVTSEDGELYLQLQDLLSDFNEPCVMDCKIGVRTYLEEELSKAKEKPKLRKDMYEKMIQIDPNAPSEDENKAKGVTKPRYMVWRETISSTATFGFRIEGIKKGDGTSSKDFKTTKSIEQILNAFKDFTYGFPHAVPKYIHRLKAIRATLECSDFFANHEVIGSSLLFVHDRKQASVWLIDFAKTVILPINTSIDHRSKWSVGNHEDGYLIGINNLIDIFDEVQSNNSNCKSSMLNALPSNSCTSESSGCASNISNCTKDSGSILATSLAFPTSSSSLNVVKDSKNAPTQFVDSSEQVIRNTDQLDQLSLNISK